MVADTLNRYVVFDFRPVIVSERLVDGADFTVSQVAPLFFEYSIVKLLIGPPLTTAEAFQAKTTEVFEALTLSDEGAVGTLPRVVAETTVDGSELPIAFTALTRKQYFVPGFRPVSLKPRFVEAARLIVVKVEQLLETSIL